MVGKPYYPKLIVFPDGQHTTLLKPEDLIEFVQAYMGTDAAELYEHLTNAENRIEDAGKLITVAVQLDQISDELATALEDALYED